MHNTQPTLGASALKDLYDRQSRAMTRRPAFARGSGYACVHMGNGLACDVHHADHLSRVDQPESEGGTGTAPHPGQLMRASIGGRTSVCVWGRRAACGWADVFPIVDARVESEVCPLFFALGNPGALTFAFQRAGLIEVVEESIPVTLTWASADEACGAMLEGGPVSLAWKRFTPTVRAEVRTAYLASLAPFRRGPGYAVPSEIVFATARKPAA